jgi:hypothetical protein
MPVTDLSEFNLFVTESLKLDMVARLRAPSARFPMRMLGAAKIPVASGLFGTMGKGEISAWVCV